MNAVTPLQVLPARLPLAQVEVLVAFHPSMQAGGPHKVKTDEVVSASQGWLTVDVFGRKGVSDLTGKPILEDARFEVCGQDIESILPDRIVTDICNYVLGGI